MSEPISVELEANQEYYYCTCGKSEDKIFCNGAHQKTQFEPKIFTVEKSDTYYLCPCKKSDNKPFCDGAHTN